MLSTFSPPKRNAGTGAFSTKVCSFCKSIPTGHYCMKEVPSGSLFEGQRRCLRPFCLCCMHKHQYEDRKICPLHNNPTSSTAIRSSPRKLTPRSTTTAPTSTKSKVTRHPVRKLNLSSSTSDADLSSLGVKSVASRNNAPVEKPPTRKDKGKASTRIRVGRRCHLRRSVLFQIASDAARVI